MLKGKVDSALLYFAQLKHDHAHNNKKIIKGYTQPGMYMLAQPHFPW